MGYTDGVSKTQHPFRREKNMAVINITKENFAQEVLHSEKPVLLDFWASWCGPCRMLSPVVDEVAEERTDVKVGKVNVTSSRTWRRSSGDEHPHPAGVRAGQAGASGRGCPPQGRCAGAAGLRCADRAIRRRLRVAFFLCSPAVNSCGPAVKHFRLSVQTHRKNVRWSCKHCHFPALQLYQDKVK